MTHLEYMQLADELPVFTKMMILREYDPKHFSDADLMGFVHNGDLGEYQLSCEFVNACSDGADDIARFKSIVSEHTRCIELPSVLGDKYEKLKALIQEPSVTGNP